MRCGPERGGGCRWGVGVGVCGKLWDAGQCGRRRKSPAEEGQGRDETRGVYDKILGHLILSPSSHRIYRSSAMGDRLTGDASEPVSAPGVAGNAPEGPAISSTTSVTTSPRFVISLFRVTRLCGKRSREVCTCCRTATFLAARQYVHTLEKRNGQKTKKNRGHVLI